MYMVPFEIELKHVRAHQAEPSQEDPSWPRWYGNKIADELATKKD